ncbi:tol-pal system YbgF family protein [Dysgonomonas sp. BGC7]|uniref:tetratricopeptide repeat protein n=1 Tax=Dysgonomonas sp. BGC7 TaxID=1658008 RepID=UPI000683604E|nr:tetratricopeptide repeat protein [Dysgonomonas sp. BGC7]MBD8388007.1 hypothetical protein [Dysgonomonas sp. BGC7]
MSSKKKQAELNEEKDWEKIDTAVHESEHFIEKYQKQIFAVIGVVVLVVCGYLAFNHFYLTPKNEEAQAAIFKGEQYFRTGQDSLAIYGDGKGYVGFETIISEYGSTSAGNLAKFYAGVSYANLGKYEQALTMLKDYSGKDKIIAQSVNGTIGDCLDNTGKTEEALSYYLKAAKGVDNAVQSPIFYKKAGLIYRDQANYDKVIEVFSTIKNQYMGSPLAMEADKYIDEANLLKSGSGK